MQKAVTGRRCILFARGGNDNQYQNSILRQITQMRDFARRRKLRVVDEVRLMNTSAISPATAEALEALLARKAKHEDFDLLLTADLSRMSRGGICHTMQSIMRFADAGVRVMTLDNGIIDEALFSTFRVRISGKKKGWIRRNAKQKKAHHLRREASHDSDGDGAVQGSSQPLPDGTDRTRVERGAEG